MLVRHHHTDGRGAATSAFPRRGRLGPRSCATLASPTWPSRPGRCLPSSVPAASRPHLDLLRGLLASVLGPLSTRRLGAWAVLSGRADLAEAAWRQRLRVSNDWLLWLLGALRAVPEVPARPGPRPAGRLGRGGRPARSASRGALGMTGGCPSPTTSRWAG